MKLLLVKPSIGGGLGRYRLNDGPMEPLALGLLAALTPPDWECHLRDDRLQPVDLDEEAELVAITVDSYSARRAYQLADAFRARGVPVALGGMHVTLLPDEAAAHADTLVLGDADSLWPRLLEDLRTGALQPRYTAPAAGAPSGLFPRRELFEGKAYLPFSLIQFSRGCTFHCSYCSVAAYYQRRHHCREVAEVVREIESSGRRQFLFVDDNIALNRSKALELFRALKPLKIRWASQAGIDVADDPALLEAMAESGCVGNLIGFESIDPEALRWMDKSNNLRSQDKYRQVLERLASFGFQTWASFIIGNDCDTPASIRETVEYAIESRFTLAFFHLFMPYPGTRLYEQLAAEGRLLYDGAWWTHPDFGYNRAAFRPKHMSPDELGELAEWANRRFYSLPSILRRSLDPRTNLRSPRKAALYWGMNRLLRNTST